MRALFSFLWRSFLFRRVQLTPPASKSTFENEEQNYCDAMSTKIARAKEGRTKE
tara:strand:- start:37 stop:198 length:162 start_codon:yes stop_codon:yes gene_type:complete